MKYKAISSAIAVLLISTPVFAQKSVPILTQTLRTTNPTTVITGQSLRQTYVVRFIDLSHLGEKIIVQKDALDQKSLGDFEVLNFKIDYETKQGQFLEHYWYVNYILRIINPKKGPKVIPSFVVPWKHKKSGQQENDPGIQTNYDLKTEEVHLNYASTIPEKDPYLAIRDQIDFGAFRMHGLILKSVSWFLAVVPSGLWLVFFIRRLKSSDMRSREEETKVTRADESINEVVQISKRRALRNLCRGIRKLQKAKETEVNTCVHGVLIILKDFLRAKTGLSVGTTPLEMVTHISSNKKFGSFQKPLLALAEKAREYQNYLESGSVLIIDANSETKKLQKLLCNLRWYNRLFRRR
ncbi:MAG: hypothetical protein AAB857_04385 [Patescibacteria group bacterium]|mgnify:CR=1 FL=1